MSGKTLYDKLWDSHLVRQDADGTALLYIDRHLVHEVTSPQAFEGVITSYSIHYTKLYEENSVIPRAAQFWSSVST